MSKCLNCGYERQSEDVTEFTPATECPKCHAIYEKGKTRLLKEYEEAEKWFSEKEKESIGKTRQSKEQNAADQTSSSDTKKNCPYCSEEIKADAVKCRYCGEWLSIQTTKQVTSPVKSKVKRNIIHAIPFIWKELPFGPRAIVVFIMIFVLGSILSVINNTDRKQNESPPQWQALQEQRTRSEEVQSAALLAECRSSCRNVSSLFKDGGNKTAALLEGREQTSQCISQCEQQALTRNIEIRKLREIQKQP